MNTDPGIERLLADMRRLSTGMDTTDPRRPFHDAYMRTTEAVAAAIESGYFVDATWVERWDVAFAGLYLDALEKHLMGDTVPGPWRVALSAGKAERVPPLRLVLLGMNAHINFDLPQALLAVIPDEDWGDVEVMARREVDHRRIDEILASRVAAEDKSLKAIELPGDRTLLDHLLTPFNRRGTKRFLSEARAKVWHNARVLAQARRTGTLERRIAELEDLSRRRVADLVRPGQVILELARNGFGVTL